MDVETMRRAASLVQSGKRSSPEDHGADEWEMAAAICERLDRIAVALEQLITVAGPGDRLDPETIKKIAESRPGAIIRGSDDEIVALRRALVLNGLKIVSAEDQS